MDFLIETVIDFLNWNCHWLS